MTDETSDAPTTYEMSVQDAIRMAVASMQRGGRAEGRALLQRVLEVDPDNADAIHFMAVAAFQDEEMETSRALFARALELAPNQPDIWSNFGNVCSELDDADAAIAAYRRAIELAPDAVHIVGNLIAVLRVTGQFEEALKLVRDGLARAPTSMVMLNNACNLYGDIGQYELASACIARILELQKPTPQILEMMAESYARAGEKDKAVQAYKDLLAYIPDDPNVMHHLAALSGQNVPDRATDAYIKQTFDSFSQSFDAKLRQLDYRAPYFVADALAGVVGQPRQALEILDAGCGTGLCAPLVKAHARRLVGIDLSEGMLVRARRRGLYDQLEEAELTRYMLDHPDSFDAITCADTLCYFGDLSEACAAARGALRDGGPFLFTVEENQADAQPHRLQVHGRYCHTEDHVRQACAAAGFASVTVERGVLRSESGLPVHGLVVTAQG